VAGPAEKAVLKKALIASDPGTFFTTSHYETPHYDGYASVLVRLSAIDVTELSEILDP